MIPHSNTKNGLQALLSGCSAGGLASILHCDKFGDLLPAGATVKCLSDAGYFINAYVRPCFDFLFFLIYTLVHLTAKYLTRKMFFPWLHTNNRKDITGTESIKAYYNEVVNTHVCLFFHLLTIDICIL